MRSVLAVAVVAALGLPALAEDKGAKEELARFTGTWVGVSVVRDGKEMPADQAEKIKLVVKGEKYTYHVGGMEIEVALQLLGNVVLHDGLSLLTRNRARIAVVFSHSRSAFSTCLRPARVSL